MPCIVDNNDPFIIILYSSVPIIWEDIDYIILYHLVIIDFLLNQNTLIDAWYELLGYSMYWISMEIG